MELISLDILHDNRFSLTVSGDNSAWQARLEPRRKSIKRHLQRIKISGRQHINKIDIEFGDGRVMSLTLTAVTSLDRLSPEHCKLLEAPDCDENRG